MCSDREFCSEISQNFVFSGEIGNSFEFLSFCDINRFEMSKYTSSPNLVKKMISEEVMTFSVFTNLHGH